MARILVIEDNDANLSLMNYLLKAYGHSVESARDGLEGLELAHRGQADLIVCDVHMPKLDGYEIARRLKADPAFVTPLIAVTALAMVGDRDKVLAAGFDGYIAKPIEPTDFVSEIESYLQGAVQVAPPQASAGAAVSPSPPQTPGPRVLVVDDSPVNHQLTRALLAPFGHQLSFVIDAEAATAVLRTQDFDLVISDLHMPDDDGLALLARIKAEPRWRSLPVMLISSSSDGTADARRARELGAADFILRPIEPEQLLAAIAASLSTGAAGGGNAR